MPHPETFDGWMVTLQWYVEDYTVHEIATGTHKSVHTVESHLKSIRAFAQTHNIAVAYRKMLLLGYIKLK